MCAQRRQSDDKPHSICLNAVKANSMPRTRFLPVASHRQCSCPCRQPLRTAPRCVESPAISTSPASPLSTAAESCCTVVWKATQVSLVQTAALPPGIAKPDALGHMRPCFVRWRNSAYPNATPRESVMLNQLTSRSCGIWTCHQAAATLTPTHGVNCAPTERLRRQRLARSCRQLQLMDLRTQLGRQRLARSGDSRQTGFLVVNGCKSGNARPRVCRSHAYRFDAIHQNTARHVAAMLQTEASPDRVACPTRTVTPGRRDDLEPC